LPNTPGPERAVHRAAAIDHSLFACQSHTYRSSHSISCRRNHCRNSSWNKDGIGRVEGGVGWAGSGGRAFDAAFAAGRPRRAFVTGKAPTLTCVRAGSS
jgi:hypothetical protein